MKPRDFCEEAVSPLDIRQIFVTDLLLLGFDTTAASARIPFNKNMFDLPNKNAFETVMYFLFKKLNSVQCHESFRECWPIADRKQEHLFRKTCIKWLTEISEKDPEAHLPRVVASLFLSPGGRRFCQFLYSFTRYVLLKVIRTDLGRKDRLHHPTLAPDSSHLGDIVEQTVQANTVRYRNKFFQRLQEFELIQKEWQHYSAELVKEHRHLCKLSRDKEKELNALLQVSADRGSPIPRSRRSGGVSDYDLDIQTVRRTQKIQKVRSLWKSLTNYFKESQQERDIIQSILQGVADKYKIDASNINVKVPEVLLREFDRELQSRAVSNTYEGGNLNLLSVIQLWNLSLHLYMEKIHEVGIPDLKDVSPRIGSHVHTHNAHLADLNALEARLKKELIPNLKDSIRELQARLDNTTQKAKTPPTFRTSSLRLGLLPPTPPVTFNGSPVDSDAVPSRPLMKTPGSAGPSHLKKRVSSNKNKDESTPEAATRLISDIRQQRQSPLVQGSPLLATRNTFNGQRIFHSQVPVAVPQISDERPSEGRVRQRSAPSKVSSNKKTPSKQVMAARGHLTAQVKRSKPAVTREKLYSQDSTSSVMSTPTTPHRKELSDVFSCIKRVPTPDSISREDKFYSRDSQSSIMTTPSTPLGKDLDVFSCIKPAPTPGSTSRERAETVLVDKIVDSIMSFSPLYQPTSLSREHTPQEVKDVNLKDPLAALEESAFVVRDKINRSPAQDKTTIPKMNLNMSKDSSDSPQECPRLKEQEVLLEKFEEVAGLDKNEDDLNVSDTNNNNNYIGEAQQKLEEIFRRSPESDEEEKQLEELLSFSMKIDDSYLHDTDDDSEKEDKSAARKISPPVENPPLNTQEEYLEKNSGVTSAKKRKVHFSDDDERDSRSTIEVSTHNHYDDLLDFASGKTKEQGSSAFKRFTLDDDVLNGYGDLVVGGEVLNGDDKIEELKHNESLQSSLQDTSTDHFLDIRPDDATQEISVPLINTKEDSVYTFMPSGSTSYRDSSRIGSIHSNMLDESIEDLNDVSLGDMAAPEYDDDLDDFPKSPPQATSPSELEVDPAEESKLSSATGISSDLLMRFQRLKLSNASTLASLKNSGLDDIPSLGLSSVEEPEEDALDSVYLMHSPRPKDEAKRFTLELAFDSDTNEPDEITAGEEAEDNFLWSPDHKSRFKSRLDDMLGDDDSLLVPSSP